MPHPDSVPYPSSPIITHKESLEILLAINDDSIRGLASVFLDNINKAFNDWNPAQLDAFKNALLFMIKTHHNNPPKYLLELSRLYFWKMEGVKEFQAQNPDITVPALIWGVSTAVVKNSRQNIRDILPGIQGRSYKWVTKV